MTKLYDGDTFDHAGRTFRVRFEHDDMTGAPWEEYDGHGIVSDWRRGQEKAPGERVLIEPRHVYRRFYDFASTMKIAKRDGWGLVPEQMDELRRKLGREPTKGQIVAAAVERDFEFLRAWCNDEWEYLVVTVAMLDREGEETEYRDTLGGVESWQDYHVEQAYEMAGELARQRRRDIAAKAKETRERNYWAARDVQTRT